MHGRPSIENYSKNDIKSIQNGANLAQAVGNEYSNISKNEKKKTKKRKRKHTIEKTLFFQMCGDFFKIRRAKRLGVCRCFMKTSDNDAKMMYKT